MCLFPASCLFVHFCTGFCTGLSPDCGVIGCFVVEHTLLGYSCCSQVVDILVDILAGVMRSWCASGACRAWWGYLRVVRCARSPHHFDEIA